MKVGDLVRYRKWYTGKLRFGIIVEESTCGSGAFYVMWPSTEPSWEDCDDIEIINEGR